MYGSQNGAAQGLIDAVGRIPRGIQGVMDTITAPVTWAENGLERLGLHLPGLGGSLLPAQQMNWQPEPNAEQAAEIQRMRKPLPKGK